MERPDRDSHQSFPENGGHLVPHITPGPSLVELLHVPAMGTATGRCPWKLPSHSMHVVDTVTFASTSKSHWTSLELTHSLMLQAAKAYDDRTVPLDLLSKGLLPPC